MIPTLEEIQRRWKSRWADPVITKPSCYNHQPYVDAVTSDEFPSITYDFRQSRECPHWHVGGNSDLREYCDSAGGHKTPWSACFGCTWKQKQKG